MKVAHPDQKGLINSQNDTLSDEESDTAHRQIRTLAGRDGMDKVMKDGELDVIVANSDGELVMFAAFTGKIAYLPFFFLFSSFFF
jgi:hypothetical protein